ncbi:MAG: hypothetical protein CL563_04190 [Alphaproteobacteria bacterium]|nr:hypothetical protein [Alphaproteobacteria bacterium]
MKNFPPVRRIVHVNEVFLQSWMVAGGLWRDVIHGSHLSRVFGYSNAINTATNNKGTINFTSNGLN